MVYPRAKQVIHKLIMDMNSSVVNMNTILLSLTNVLSLLGLESQLVDGSFSPDNLEDIDYLDVGNKLEAMKKLSKAYINRIISE